MCTEPPRFAGVDDGRLTALTAWVGGGAQNRPASQGLMTPTGELPEGVANIFGAQNRPASQGLMTEL